MFASYIYEEVLSDELAIMRNVLKRDQTRLYDTRVYPKVSILSR